MDILPDFVVKLVVPFLYPLLPVARIFLLYLLGALALAYLVYRGARRAAVRRGEAAEGGVTGFLRFCFPSEIYAHPSAIVDYKFYVISRLSHAFIFVPLMFGAPAVAAFTAEWLGGVAGVRDAAGADGFGVRILLTLAALVAFDLGVFVAHYLQHKVPLLWEFHKVHHSAQVITPITVYRMHPVDDILTGTTTALAVGVVTGALSFVAGTAVAQLEIAGVNLVLFVYYLAGYNLRHSHIWLEYPRFLTRFLISPAQHQIHHSAAPEHTDKNLGFVFSFWDRWAGTLYVPHGRERIGFGLARGEDREYDGVIALYLLPFKKAAALLTRRREPSL